MPNKSKHKRAMTLVLEQIGSTYFLDFVIGPQGSRVSGGAVQAELWPAWRKQFPEGRNLATTGKPGEQVSTAKSGAEQSEKSAAN